MNKQEAELKFRAYFRREVLPPIHGRLQQEGYVLADRNMTELVIISIYAKFGMAVKKIHNTSATRPDLEVVPIPEFMNADELLKFIEYIVRWAKGRYGVQFRTFAEYSTQPYPYPNE